MDLIVAVDLNWGIGYQNGLLASISDDMKRIKELTLGQVVILGRNTLQSFPGGRPLAGRTNIILTQQVDFHAGDALICHSIEELAVCIAPLRDQSIYLLGGGSLYKQLLPFCDLAYVTRFHQSFQADTFFPNLDQMPGWQLLTCSPVSYGQSRIGTSQDPLAFQFCLYRQKNPACFFPDLADVQPDLQHDLQPVPDTMRPASDG